MSATGLPGIADRRTRVLAGALVGLLSVGVLLVPAVLTTVLSAGFATQGSRPAQPPPS